MLHNLFYQVDPFIQLKDFFPNSKTTEKVINPDDFNLISNFEAR